MIDESRIDSAADLRRSAALGGRYRAALALIFVIALALRWWGVGHGLPHTYHPDEHQYVDTAVRMIGGDLDPARFNNPSGLKYAFAVVFGIWARVGSLAGEWGAGEVGDSIAAFQSAFAADPTAAHIVARALVGLMGAATVLVTFALGSRLAGPRAGLVSAFLLSVAFLHARDSHYAVSDVPAALLVALVLHQAMRMLDTQGRSGERASDADQDRDAEGRSGNPASDSQAFAQLRSARHAVASRPLLTGALLTGLAAGTKYSALAVIAPLLLAHLLAGTKAAENDGPLTFPDFTSAIRRMLKPRPLAAALAVPLLTAAAFLAMVPYAILNRPAFDADIATLAARGEAGFKGLMIDPAPGWIFYLESLTWALGLPLLVAAIAGIFIALGSRRPAGIVIASFPLLLWGYLGGELLMFARFMIPAIPPLCALAGLAVERAIAPLEAAAQGRRSGDLIAVALTAALAVVPALSTIRHDILLTRDDTRTHATRWIEANFPAGTPILLQSAGPDLQPEGDEPVPGTTVPYKVEKVGTLDLPDRSLDEWRADGWEVLVTSSNATERRLIDPEHDAAYRAYYASLDEDLPMLAEFAPHTAGPPIPFVYAQVYGPATDLRRLLRPGPIIRVYRLSQD